MLKYSNNCISTYKYINSMCTSTITACLHSMGEGLSNFLLLLWQISHRLTCIHRDDTTTSIQRNTNINSVCTSHTHHLSNSYIPPWGVVLHIGVGHSPTPIARHQCARPHPREGYNYYITCYLGNITVQERYGQHS